MASADEWRDRCLLKEEAIDDLKAQLRQEREAHKRLLEINEELVHSHNALVIDGARLDREVAQLQTTVGQLLEELNQIAGIDIPINDLGFMDIYYAPGCFYRARNIATEAISEAQSARHPKRA